MKKIVLAIAIAVSMCNLAIGITYAAVCQDSHGDRFCGHDCQTGTDGVGCQCSGACSNGEMNWVAGGKGGAGELEEVFDY